MTLDEVLAFADATLAAGTVVCATRGYRAIRRRDVIRHRNLMLAAFACSAAFMILFIVRFVTFGFRDFTAAGGWKALYYVVLFAHEPIAVLSIPLVLVTLVLGLRRSRAHIEVARPTLVVWLISAMTGVLLYVVLYSLPIGK